MFRSLKLIAFVVYATMSLQDDMEAGWLVEDNLFESIHDCMFIGGGRQNTVRGNTFKNCTMPVHVDDRGLGWMKCEFLARFSACPGWSYAEHYETCMHA